MEHGTAITPALVARTSRRAQHSGRAPHQRRPQVVTRLHQEGEAAD
ncbi:hypothetical protein [Peterkaempfera sp. SMS 1(5)a]